MTLRPKLTRTEAQRAQGNWVPACGGREVPFCMQGRRLHYLWQPATGRHAYLDCDTDLLLTDAEVDVLFLRGS